MWRRPPTNHNHPDLTIGNPCWLWSRWRSRRLPEPGRIVVEVFQASFTQRCSSSGVKAAWQLASSLAHAMCPDTGSPIGAAAIDSRTPGNYGRRCRRPAWPSSVLRFPCNSAVDSSYWPYKAFRSCARCREHLALTVSVLPSASPTFRSLFIQGGFSSRSLRGHSSPRLDDVLSAISPQESLGNCFTSG